jgi:excisionase family DNA binding protein
MQVIAANDNNKFMVKVANLSPGPESYPLSYTLETAAQVTGFSARTLRRLVKRGLLRPSRATHKFIFPRAEIDRFLRETTAE